MTIKKNCESILGTGGGLLALGSFPIITTGQRKAKKMFYDFNDKDQNLYNNYKFEKFTHEDALYIYFKIMELKVCSGCNSIRDIQNIKTKCAEILNKLDTYKTDEV